MKTKTLLYIFTLLALAPQLTLATTQDLTYDNPTNQVNISYDVLNRILTKNTTSVNITYFYDKDYEGTLSNITFSNSSYQYEYDDKLRVTREIKIIDGMQFEKRNYYDSMDRLVSQVLTPGQELDYNYNNQSKVSRILNFVTNIFYNAFDNPVNRTYNNNKLTEFAYNSQNARLSQIKTDSIQNLTYYYDKAGNIIAIDDKANNRTYNMTYDFLDRLVNASIGGQTFAYSYNAIGNILKIIRNNLNTTKFVYNGTLAHAPSQVVTGDAGIDVINQLELRSTNRTRTIQFYITDEKNTTANSGNWTIDFGNIVVNSTIAFNVLNNESILVVAENNYSNAGDYKINITGRSASSSADFEALNSKFGVKVTDLAVTKQDRTVVDFKFQIFNDMDIASASVSWSCSEGISSNSSFTMAAKEYRNITFNYNYSLPEKKSFTCYTNSTDGNHSKTIDFNIKGIAIEDYNASSLSANNRLIKFNITNYYYPSTVRWYVTSDGQSFSNTVTLATNQSNQITQNITYTTAGEKNVSVVITSGSLSDRHNETFTLKSLEIENLNSYIEAETNRTFNFTIRNYWPQSLSVSWNMSDPSVTNNNVAALAQGESVNITHRNNYTTQGRKANAINVYSGSFLGSFIDRFRVEMASIAEHSTLYENQSSTIQVITAVNNIGQSLMSWLFKTDAQSIASSQDIILNTSEGVFIVIETNYSNSGIFPTNITINTTSYNDNSTIAIIN